jgi:uncharacterized protein YndB with AHSA1/START domain
LSEPSSGAEPNHDGSTVHAWAQLHGVSASDALAAWTDPERLRDWWGGELNADLQHGGSYVVGFGALGQTMRGRVLTYQPAARLAFTWSWDHEPDAVSRKVDIRVLEVEDGVRIEIEHGPYGDTDTEQTAAKEAREGWEHFLPRLVSNLTPNS